MARIKFYIQSKHEGQPATVYLRFNDGREIDIWTPTPVKLFPEHWNNKSQSFRQRIPFTEDFSEQEKVKIEKKLLQLKSYLATELLKLNGIAPTKDGIKTVIDNFYNKEAPSTETLNQYIKRFVDEATSGKRLANPGNTKKRYSYGSIRILRGFMLSFNMFQGIETEGISKRKGKKYPKQPYKPLNWNDISIDTYNDFVAYFYSRDCGANYIGKHIKSFKTIMRQAREEGLHNNMEIERKAFKTLTEEVDHIYLSEAELKRLYELDLSDNIPFQEVRDVFLAGCYTAQRYSDYSKINKSNIKEIDGIKYIELIQKKTNEKCIIPIRSELETILQRYDYTLPKTFEQKVNEGIKKIGAKANITELIHVEKNKGGMIVKTDVKKCDLIQTHCARRTGCTNMFLAKDEKGNRIPIIEIMKISGHKTEREFQKYINITKEQTAINLASHPYFNQNKLKIVKV